ncbi:MAG: mitochondrial fission ELM1 family protein [Alphaproteobacteria bacterium]
MNEKNTSCWVLSEGIAGTENQCIAVAEVLGSPFDVKRIKLQQPWKSLSPYIGFEQGWSFVPALRPPYPDLLIAAGRKSIAASRYIKRASGGKTFTVQIQDPRISPKHFDLVAVPHHDPARGDNIIVTDAAPNRVSSDGGRVTGDGFSELAALPSPRVAVLLGGDSKAYRFDARAVAAQLSEVKGSLMITPSRRTGAENVAILRDALPDAYIWGGAGENPYFAMLALADVILVTADSASMISDACSTGKPVYMIEMEGGHPRIDKLHKHLQDIGALRRFEGNLEVYRYEPLNDAAKIARAIEERFKR